jgi:adenylosuccinate synthase
MSNVVIIGTQWGDEGKGKVVDLLTEHADVIVRFQGGPNAGHTVVVGDKKTILHQVPSGILHPGKQCVIGNGVVLDIETLIGEIDLVKAQGYFRDDAALLISENAHLIMPYHKSIDIAREKMKGAGKIGTTGRGIGPAYEDKVGRSGIRLADIFNDTIFRTKLEQNLKEKNFYLKNYLGEAQVAPDDVFSAVTALRERLRSYVGNAALFLHGALAARKKVLFEGAQGAMLDIDHGTYPFVTSSNTAAANAAIGSGVGPRNLDVIVGIVKAYTTRVGAGPFPTEQDNDLGLMLRDKGDEYGATTGRPRRCGWLDLAVVQHAVRMNSISHLLITKLDVLSGLKTIKVCTGYTCAGNPVAGFPSDLAVLESCTPVYDELEGWQDDLTGVTSYDQLPDAAKRYISYIEQKTATPISMVSVGYRRDQIITLIDPFSVKK